MQANPILVTATRSQLDEVVHRGAFCVVRSDGHRCAERGDCDSLTYPRSALKLVQVLPLLESGAVEKYGITDEEIALMCASHNGEPRHVVAAKSILGKALLQPEHLRCGTHPPMSSSVQAALNEVKATPTALHNNCSGKHSGFLALAQHLQSDLASYLALDHPVQVRIREAVCDVYDVGESDLHVGVDGCTAPNYAMSLYRMALGMARLSTATEHFQPTRLLAIETMKRVITEHPFMVAGTNRFCTELMTAVGGLVFAKLGAAGVYVLGIPQHRLGAAIKIDDGTTGPQYAVALAILDALGCLDAQSQQTLQPFARAVVNNCRNEPVGYRQVTPELHAYLRDQLA